MKYDIEKLKKAIKETPLSERERLIISYRFGLDDFTTRTLEEVGKMFGVTRERVRQIEAKVLEKIGGIEKYLTKER